MSRADDFQALLKPRTPARAPRRSTPQAAPLGTPHVDAETRLQWDSKAPLRVLIADQQPLYRDGLSAALAQQPHFACIAQASDQEESLAQIRSLQPAVAVVGLDLPGPDAIPLAGQLVAERLPTRLLILTAHPDPERGYAAVQAGARGCLFKHEHRATVCAAIAAVARGHVALSPEIQSCLVRHVKGTGPAWPSLTPRETEILRNVADGMSNGQIASRLFLSQATIKGHLQDLYERLEVPDRTAAAVQAVRLGLLP